MEPSVIIRHWSETLLSFAQCQHARRTDESPRIARLLKLQSRFSGHVARAFSNTLSLSNCAAVDVSRRRSLSPRRRGWFSRRGVLASVAMAILLVFASELSTHFFLALGEGDRIPRLIAGWAPAIVFGTIGLYLLQLRTQSRSFRLSLASAAPYTCAMINPLATDWPIKQRAEICNATHRPFTPGEVFYTLLYREGDGFRARDLSEEAWRDRNETSSRFHFGKQSSNRRRRQLLEALPTENAEQLFRRLMHSRSPGKRLLCSSSHARTKRVLKQVRTEIANGDRLLIYEHRENGDVFMHARSAIAPERARTGAGPGSSCYAAVRPRKRLNSGHPA